MAFISQSFSPEQLGRAESLTLRAAAEVAPTLKEHFGEPTYQTKADERDWVTQWDGWAEEKIKGTLAKLGSDIGFIGEENGQQGNPDVFWTIDALDGTSHYVRGNDHCTTMIALVDHDVPVASCIYDFMRGTPYTAVVGQGAWRNEVERISVSTRPLATSYVEIYTDENTEQGDAFRKSVEEKGAYVLRTAAAGHTMLSVARGGTEAFTSLRNPFATPWDIAPGALLIREAGGIVMNIAHDTYRLSDFDFVAANQHTFSDLRRLAVENQTAVSSEPAH